MKHLGTIIEQKYVKSFEYKGSYFNQYLVRFQEWCDYIYMNRDNKHEQALIGAEVLFDYDVDKNKISKYRILNYTPIEELKK
jgi:hypothetical protein